MTAGESHGPAILGLLEGAPAGIEIGPEEIRAALARRRRGVGRGARMRFETDQLEVIGGIWRGVTTGGPVALLIRNSEWPKWASVMSPDAPKTPPAPATETERTAAGIAAGVTASADGAAVAGREAPLTRPRPGHADLAGMIKHGHADVRAVLERASARETAARVAVGAVAAAFLRQALGVRLVAHVVELGGVRADPSCAPQPDDADRLDASDARTLDARAAAAMTARVEEAKRAGDTLGGVVEVIAHGVPPGLGSYAQADRRLDALLAGALMGIQAIKAVEIGLGVGVAALAGSAVHDPIELLAGRISRPTNHAGGIEGGVSNGAPVVVRATMKPIPTLARALPSVDTTTGEAAPAIHQRSDTTAVPAAAVVAEAMTALVLAQCALEKFGGDSVAETRRNFEAYLAAIPETLR
jgi:chorismate synthase